MGQEASREDRLRGGVTWKDRALYQAILGMSQHWAVEHVKLREAEQAEHVFVKATAGTASTCGPVHVAEALGYRPRFERPGGPSSLSCVPETRSLGGLIRCSRASGGHRRSHPSASTALSSLLAHRSQLGTRFTDIGVVRPWAFSQI